jgi:hypothetical protein
MPVVLQQLIRLREGLVGKKAVIELHDDHRFVLFRIDPKSQARTETVLNVPAATLRVTGSQSFLLLHAASTRKRIDFANPNQLSGFAAGGLIGAAVADAYANPSGIRVWVDALRAHGASVKYSGMSTSMKVIFITFAALMGSLVILSVVLTLLKS